MLNSNEDQYKAKKISYIYHWFVCEMPYLFAFYFSTDEFKLIFLSNEEM